MSGRITELLGTIYGGAQAPPLAQRVAMLIEQHRAANPSTRLAVRSPLSERDVLLITYGDQVSEAGVPPLATLAEFMIRELRGIVSGIHLLPFYPFSSDDGFSVIDYYAVNPAWGTWDHINRLGEHFDLMFDAVVNHVSARSRWFQEFLNDVPPGRNYFIAIEGEPDLSNVVRPRALPLLTEFATAAGSRKVWTTFSADQVDLNFSNPEVLIEILRVLLYYVSRGARFIRLDAIAYLWKEIGTPCIHLPRTHAIVQLFRAVLDQAAPGVFMITETNVPHADNLSYFGDGSNEAQLVYNFALPPLVLHTFHTGDATALANWAATLSVPSRSVTFFNFLASHDGIGVNPVRGLLSPREIDELVARAVKHGGDVSYKHNPDGTRSPYELNINFFDALSDPGNPDEPVERQVARFLAAQSILLALAGVPGIYFHSLFGSRGDRAGAEASGIPRRINRQKFSREMLEHELKDPRTLRAAVFARYVHLLKIRQSHAAFNPHGEQRVVVADPRVFGVLRVSPDGAERVLCLHNVSSEPVQFTIRFAEDQAAERWVNLIDGSEHSVRAADTVELEPYEVVWVMRESR